MRVVLDTHALVYWCSQPTRFSPAQQHAVGTISEENPAVVADITLWEISALVSGGRLKLDLPLREWLTNATAPPLVRVAEITPSIAHEVEMLSNWENQDPADRLIVATARVYGARLVTNDEAMRSLAVVDTI